MVYGLALLAALIACNVWVSRRVLSSEEDASRKKLFVAGIWLMPFLGALIFKDIGKTAPAAAPEPEADREEAPLQLLLPSGATFDLQQHMGLAEGVPWLDWSAARDAAQAEGEAQGQCLAAMQRAWLLHLRDALGPQYQLAESGNAIVVSSLDAVTRTALMRYVATTRQRVVRVLDGIAELDPAGKSVVLVVDDEETYYRYIATYYASEGEFAFSGGMFIGGDCPHFVVKRGELQAVEPVIAHELTHSALAHLHLPLWIDEGLAVNTEHRLTGVPRGEFTAQQLHGRHLAFWNPERIQEFWSGRSFQRTDDGNLLSYELARILVQELSRDWAAFVSFVRAARRDDAGHAAAIDVLDTHLGHAVCVLFDQGAPEDWRPQRAS